MSYAADLHVHSRYAIGTSRTLDFETLTRWAKIKGIDLLASADFTHRDWFRETREKLIPCGDGLYEFDGVKFVLGTEVSSVSAQGGRSRRVHLLLFAPSVDVVEQINRALDRLGSLRSDGRPSLRISCRDLVHLVLGIDARCVVIPAHAWTPWFGVFGSKSGFDSLEECFGDAAGFIYAVETGLSSEPAMNWRVPELDSRSIVSFSDAHSAPKLGRELTVFSGRPTYDGLVHALKTQAIDYTVEFFPQEGKYHLSGHRKCRVRRSPEEDAGGDGRCPLCGRPLTLGVAQRVERLAGREVETWLDENGLTRADNGRPPFRMLVGLQQIIAEALGVGVGTKGVQVRYQRLVAELGNELAVLTRASQGEIARASSQRIAEGVALVRSGKIRIEPGYDGVYGSVSIWDRSTATRPHLG